MVRVRFITLSRYSKKIKGISSKPNIPSKKSRESKKEINNTVEIIKIAKRNTVEKKINRPKTDDLTGLKANTAQPR